MRARDKYGKFIKVHDDVFCKDCHKKISIRATRCKSCCARNNYNKTLGKYLTNNEQRIRIRKIQSEKKIGKLNPMYGKTHSEINRKKISIKLKKAYSEGRNKVWSTGIEIPMKVKIKSSCSQRKITPKEWKEFTKYNKYPKSFFDTRCKILLRDWYKCRVCGINLIESSPHVHHIDYNKKNNDCKNLITICSHCHGKINSNKTYWINKLKTMV